MDEVSNDVIIDLFIYIYWLIYLICICIQVQMRVRYLRKNNQKNTLQQIAQLIEDNQYHENLNDDDLFYFNCKFEPNSSKIKLGDGNDNNHLNICLTSRSLMKYCEYNGVFQLDCTYKIIKNRFPLVVFGNCDIKGKFFPIAFMISSHETEEDFFQFYSGLIELADKLNIYFEPQYIMQNA